MDQQEDRAKAYWRANIRLLSWLLVIWFLVSFGAGILFVDELNQIKLGGFPLGFWFAQQGSIYVFILLIVLYAIGMGRIERRFGIHDEDEPDSYDLPDAHRDSGADQ